MNNKLPRQNILIVDDVPANIKMLQVTLMCDYDISVSTNGPEAIEIAISNPPDLILLDILMPEMDGYEVCRRLKANSRTRHIPVIFITAIDEEEEESKGFKLGAVDYIRKPFSPIIVKARVSTHLNLKLHRDHLEELNTVLKQEISERKRSEAALKHLLKKQDINIELAKKLLRLVNGTAPRYIDLTNGRILFVDAISLPCYAEGGDHYFVRPPGANKQGRPGKTFISLKDQSGHEVSCVLRSIITDLIHHAVLNDHTSATMEAVISRLNNEICYSEIFSKEDFFTSVSAEIDHETLIMKYVSTGHPPFLLIREGEIRDLPGPGEKGANIPIGIKGGITYAVGETRLREGDKLIFYTDGLTEMPLKKRKKMITSDELKGLVREIISQPRQEVHTEELAVSDIMNEILSRISKISEEEVMPRTYKNEAKNTSADDITILCMEIENQKNYCESVWKPRHSEEIAKLVIDLYEKFESEWHQRGYESPDPCLRIVLEEILLNAWIHGNHRDPDKSITVRWRFRNDFHLEVIDEGKGFDYQSVPDPRSDDNLTKPCGRGIFLIQHFASHVSWKNGGSHLITSFRRYPVPREKRNSARARKLMKLWGTYSREV
ncbi:response regulator [Desulfonema magnum]|uniref:Signal transduction response regulator, receiver domain phosphatase PPM-type n=1 Tax=Desulfonema magnum TaxID=45655 RepID=A0A975BXV4_9BACT|nr:response regulator [Desulfonema magnum]QTA93831.1 Signal transduction response regulator, receiver domain phosphatase PPM-type [Desulfonema magnum]